MVIYKKKTPIIFLLTRESFAIWHSSMDMFWNLAPILILLCYQRCVGMCLLKTSSVNKLIAINAFLHSISQFASFTESSSELDQMSCRPSPFMGVKTSWRTGETMLQRKYPWVKPCMALSEGYSEYTCHHQISHREKCWASSEFCFVFKIQKWDICE